MAKQKPPRPSVKDKIYRWLDEDEYQIGTLQADNTEWGWAAKAGGSVILVCQVFERPHALLVMAPMAPPPEIRERLLALDKSVRDGLLRQIGQWLCLAGIDYEGLKFPFNEFSLKRVLYQEDLTRTGLMDAINRLQLARTAVGSMAGERLGRAADVPIDFGPLN